MANITRRLFIQGRVQGVGFRWWFGNEAEKLDLSGWVRNRSDGRVEALVHGDEDAVAILTELARRGPPHACVTGVTSTDEPTPPAGTLGSFTRKTTL